MSDLASRANSSEGTPMDSASFAALLSDLRRHTGELERLGAATTRQLDRIAEAGVMRWDISVEFGGSALSAVEQTVGMSRIAAACLVSAFVLSQRNAAVSRIVVCDNDALKAEFLPKLARHELMATVGISHLTTSRQHIGRPSVTATSDGDGYILDGSVPWVTAGAISDFILTGGILSDGRQLLALVPTDDPGVMIEEPPELLALNASQTGGVSLAKIPIGSDRIVAGPIAGVMKSAGAGTGSVTTSALAVGAAAGILEHFAAEAEKRPELTAILLPFESECEAILLDIRTLLGRSPGDDPPGLTSESIRARANSLVLRASQAFLAASKGAGFVKGHPAERAVREALFFLVWSCPQPVVNAALREFACFAE